jgi:hypothetical protein
MPEVAVAVDFYGCMSENRSYKGYDFSGIQPIKAKSDIKTWAVSLRLKIKEQSFVLLNVN